MRELTDEAIKSLAKEMASDEHYEMTPLNRVDEYAYIIKRTRDYLLSQEGDTDLKTEFFAKFGKESFRGYPLEQCWEIWDFL